MSTWYTVTKQTPVIGDDGEYHGDNRHTDVLETASSHRVTTFLRGKGDMAYEYYVTEWDNIPDDFWSEIVTQTGGEDWVIDHGKE